MTIPATVHVVRRDHQPPALTTVTSPRTRRTVADPDPLLEALRQARLRRDQAEQHIRTLLALGREYTSPRPYRLADLAAAAGMSPSGVRTSYGLAEITYLQQVLTCHQTAPDYLRDVVLALRHHPHTPDEPELACGHCGSHNVHITDQHANDFDGLTIVFTCNNCGGTDNTWTAHT